MGCGASVEGQQSSGMMLRLVNEQSGSESYESVRRIAVRQLSQTLQANYTQPFNPSRDGVVVLVDRPGSFGSANSLENIKVKRPQLSVMIKEFTFDESLSIKSSQISPSKAESTRTNSGNRIHFSPSHGSLSIGNLTINKKGLQTGESETIPYSFLLQGMSDFVVINKLGRGSSGSVLEALHVPTLTMVALKMLPIYDSDNLQHIESEIGVLLKNLAELRLIDGSWSRQRTLTVPDTVQHNDCNQQSEMCNSTKKSGCDTFSSCPQLLAMYDAFLDPRNGMVNLVVEYMDGGSLEDVVQNGGCQNEEVLADITSQVLNGVAFLHGHKQIHRDIKPGNVLLSCNGLVKLADFGISKAMETMDGNAAERSFVGTMRYMAPERISNESYGYAADIWSIGLTFLAVVFGRYPLGPVNGEIGGYWDFLRIICDESIPMPCTSHFSLELIDLLSGCLKKDPLQRISLKNLRDHNFFVMLQDICSTDAGEYTTSCNNDGNQIRDDVLYAKEGSVGTTIGIGRDRASSYGSASEYFLDAMTSQRFRSSRASVCSNDLRCNSSKLSQFAYRSSRLKGFSAMEGDEDRAIRSARTRHLEVILHKVEQKYAHDAVVIEKHCSSSCSGSGNNVPGECSHNSKSTPKLPGFGEHQWVHLAHQFNVSPDTVLAAAKKIVNSDYITPSEVIDVGGSNSFHCGQ